MLGPLTASKFVNRTYHTARDRRPQTAVSSVFYTVPVHITDVESPFPRIHACSRGNGLLEQCVRQSAVWWKVRGSKGQDLVADQQVNDELHSAQLDSQHVSSLIFCTFSDTYIFKDHVAARNTVRLWHLHFPLDTEGYSLLT